jgi:hypothetical protein
LRFKSVSLVFILVTCLIEISLGQTWNGSTSSNWNTASNWSPANVPGAGNDVVINNPSAPNQPTLPGDISIRDFTINNGALNLASFTLTVIRTATITGGTISNGTLNVRDYNSLQNTTFNGAITLIKTGPANDDTNGGNIYNGPTTIRNNGNRWRHANTNGDIFNSTVTFIKNSNGNLEVAYNGANTFNGQVTINNFIANGTFSIGLGGGTSTLNMGGLVTSSFALGNLDVRNFTQVTNTLNGTFAPATFTIGNSTLLGSFSITAANGITVLGNNRFCTGSGSLCTFVKNGGGNSDWVGGNTFGTVSITNNDINSRFRLANSGGGDIFTSTSTFTNSGTQFFEIARTGTNTFANSITINNNNSAGEVTFGAGGGTSTLTTGGVVTTGFSVGNILSFTNFTQIQNSPNSNFGVTTFTSTNSSFQGDFGVNATTINFTQTNTFARNGTFTATNINQTLAGSSFATAGGSVTFTKTGGGTNQWYGGNTFGIASFINNSNALFRLAGNAGDTYTSTSTFTNTGTNFLGIAFRGTNNFAQQITINNSNAAGEIRFGEGGGTSTLAAGGVVTSGFSVGNILEFNNFTQSQNALNGTFGVTTFTSVNSSFQGDFGVTATTINFTQANTFARNGTFTATNINQTLAGSSFATAGGSVTFTKTGGGTNQWNGGNTFGVASFINNSNALFRLAGNAGDTYTSTSTFTNTGTNFLGIAFRGTNNFAQQITINNSNAAGEIRFGEGGGTSTLAAGGVVTSGFSVGNILEFNNFTQSQNALNGTFGVTTFTSVNSSFQGAFGGITATTFTSDNSSFQRDITVTATTINFTRANTFARNGTFTATNINQTIAGSSFATVGGSVTFTKTGGGTNQWYGGNTFGPFTLINNADALVRLATTIGDTFNSTSVFTNTGNNYIDIAYRGTNTFGQQITINNSNAAGSIRFGEIISSSTSNLTSGGVVTSGFSVGNILEFNNFTQAQNAPNGTFGVTTFTSVNSSFQGDFGVSATTINFTQANTFARNGTFTASNINMTQAGNSFATAGGSVTFTKTGGGTNQWNGGNTFGVASFINNSNALFRLAGNAGDTYTSTSTFTNTGTNFLGIAFRGTNNFAQQITINNSNAAGEIRFGEGGGTSTLAAGGVVTSGFSVGNILEFNNFTQSQNALNGTFGVTTFTSVNSSFQGDFGVSATTINFTQANTFARNGTFTAANINVTQAGNSFATLGGIANFTKTGGGANNWFGGNTFGASTITNSSTANLRLANNSGDTFNNSVTFIKSGSGNVEPAYNGTTNFNGNISTVGSNASLTFGVGTGVAQINGSGAQSLSGASANSPIFRRMILDKSGFFTLNVPLQISLSGTFTNGVLNSSTSNSLTFINNATASGASDASYVAGPVVKIGNSNFEFPIGKGGFYAPSILGIGGGTSDSYTSEYFNIAPHAIPTDTIGKEPTIGLMNKSEHWSFTRSSGTVARSLALGYNSARTSSIIDHNELIMIYWDLAIFGGMLVGWSLEMPQMV